eukprot:gb/GECH01010568.1/.p1 GENE.gb/GECH01010568.1/~~gb/GECH01010568.1/.p1  ORF type:complete len:875 (+),score=171.09 gb/GECH01010568.1/:1-2625(+)
MTNSLYSGFKDKSVPRIIIIEPGIDFGIVENGAEVSAPLEIRNVCDSIVEWKMISRQDFHAQMNASQLSDDEETRIIQQFWFLPDGGVLNPNESAVVTVVFKPVSPQLLDDIVEVFVKNGPSRAVSVRAKVEAPSIRLSEYFINLGNVYKNVSIDHKITLKNDSSVETVFQWMQLSSKDEASILFSPSSGRIKGFDTVDIIFSITPLSLGKQEIVVPCIVQDSNRQVGLVVEFEVFPLSLSVEVGDPKTGQIIDQPKDYFIRSIVDSCINRALEEYIQVTTPVIDFGNVELREKKSLKLKIINHSGCFSFFVLNYEKYQAPYSHSRRKKTAQVSFAPSHSQVLSSHKASRESRPEPAISRNQHSRATMLASKEDGVYRSKKGKKYWEKLRDDELQEKFENEEVLSDQNGIAFDLNSVGGRIEGHTNSNVLMTCYSNICGRYEDQLTLEIEGMPRILIPVKVNVIGCPLEITKSTTGLKILKPKPSGITPRHAHALMSWKQQPVNELSKRTLKVRNKCPLPIEVNWDLFSKMNPISVSIDENMDMVIKETPQMSLDSSPFLVQPKQAKIPKFGHASFELLFHPKDESDISDIFAKGICEIESSNKVETDRLTPTEGQPWVTPLSIQLQGQVHRPGLTLEGEKIKISVNVNAESKSEFSKCALLFNNTHVPCGFSLDLQGPFKLSQVDKFEHKGGIVTPKRISSTSIMLFPQEYIQVKIELSNISDFKTIENLEGKLLVHFMNENQQSFDIKLKAHRPELKFEGGAKESTIDFGQVDSLNAVRKIKIVNVSKVAAEWKTVIFQDETNYDNPFEITPESGLISATNGKATLKIHFIPEKNGSYEVKYKIQTKNGSSCILILKGIAKFSEFYHAQGKI